LVRYLSFAPLRFAPLRIARSLGAGVTLVGYIRYQLVAAA
jgi:hypothetical protein